MNAFKLTRNAGCFIMVIVLACSLEIAAAPAYVIGQWQNITPSAPGVTTSSNCFWVTFAPGNPLVLYAGIEAAGVYKSTDGGSTWTRPGTAPSGCNYNGPTTFLDCAVQIYADPENSDHLYVMDGVRGCTQGFWVSTNGGASFDRRPAPANTTGDLTRLAIDPTDFKHLLVGSHQPWSGYSAGGVLETFDAGLTFTVHLPIAGFTPGSMGIGFLSDPSHGQGNSRTWIVATESGGYFRTTDAGANWSKVFDGSTAHGGTEFYYSSNGAIYSGGYQYPARSTDNGQTWAQVSNGVPYAYYADVKGDGISLFACGSGGTPISSPESDGTHWSLYGTKKFTGGPNYLRIDKVNHILYAACNTEGIWAVKTAGSSSAITKSGNTLRHTQASATRVTFTDHGGIQTRGIKKSFDIRGTMVKPGNSKHQAPAVRMLK